MNQSKFAKIISRLESLKENQPALWGKMNVSQMLAHLHDVLKIALGMKNAVDTSNFYTHYIMFPVAVYVLPFWPKGEKTAPELNQFEKGTTAKDFYTELGAVLKLLEVFDEREESKLKPHPMFGALSKKQWQDLIVKHFAHHLKQFDA